MTEHDGVRTESATAELRRLLDERGVEWDTFSVGSTEYTHWTNSDDRWCAASIGWPLGLHVNILSVTPEQAIAATLGRGECKVDVLNTGDCAGYECSEYIMHCNGCGHEFGHVLYNEDGDVWMSEPPKFCPNCGRKVVDA